MTLKQRILAFYQRYWLAVLLFLFLLPGGAAVYWLTRAKTVADEIERSPPPTKKQVRTLEKQLVQEKELRAEAEQKAINFEQKATTYQQQSIVHEQRADSLLHAPVNETATSYRTATPERLQRFLATYTPKVYLTGARDTIR